MKLECMKCHNVMIVPNDQTLIQFKGMETHNTVMKVTIVCDNCKLIMKPYFPLYILETSNWS